MSNPPLRDQARGAWRELLPALGVPSTFLNGRHQPCPICGGKDRARFDDRDGYGTYYCGQCGAGDGISLVMKVNKIDFVSAAKRIEGLLGSVTKRQTYRQREEVSTAQQREAMTVKWRNSRPIGDLVKNYLRGRGLDASVLSSDVREGDGEMLALVRAWDGKPCQIHRTLLNESGIRKDVLQNRMMMPGTWTKQSAVRLMRNAGDVDTLGIAEGIETALSAAQIFGVPTWAALNARFLESWEPPANVRRVIVFADHDSKFGGQKAAFGLAHRLAVKKDGPSVEVRMPSEPDTDFNDVVTSVQWAQNKDCNRLVTNGAGGG